MIQVKSIDFNRAEGTTEECGWRSFYTWSALHAHVMAAARTAPADGSYDKCDVAVKWADGTSFKFRFDLEHRHAFSTSSVLDDLRFKLAFYAGRERPPHVDEVDYKLLVEQQERVQPGIKAWMAQILDGGYDLGVRA